MIIIMFPVCNDHFCFILISIYQGMLNCPRRYPVPGTLSSLPQCSRPPRMFASLPDKAHVYHLDLIYYKYIDFLFLHLSV